MSRDLPTLSEVNLLRPCPSTKIRETSSDSSSLPPPPPSPPIRNIPSPESDLVEIPPLYNFEVTFQRILESQNRISKQMEQISSTMALMSHALSQRIEAESYLTYRKIDRLAMELGVDEIDTRKAPVTKPTSAQPRSKIVIRK